MDSYGADHELFMTENAQSNVSPEIFCPEIKCIISELWYILVRSAYPISVIASFEYVYSILKCNVAKSPLKYTCTEFKINYV